MTTHDNLTLESKLIRPTPGLEAIPFHYLVIYEDSEKGKKFFKMFAPGELFRPKWFRSKQHYSGFQVSAEPEYWHRCSRFFSTRDHLHTFGLDVTIKLRVSDPRTLVETRARDPLRVIEEQVFEVAGRKILDLTWDEIWDGGREFRETMRIELGGLNPTAHHFGVEILDTSVMRVLPDDAIAPDGLKSIGVQRKLEENEAQKRLREQEQAHAADLETRDVLHQAQVDMEKQRASQEHEEREQAHRSAMEVRQADAQGQVAQQMVSQDQHVALSQKQQELEVKLLEQRLETESRIHEFKMQELGLTHEARLLPERQALEVAQLKHGVEAKARGGLATAIGVIEGMVKQAGANVQSFPEMRRALQELQGIRDEIGHLASPMGGMAALPGASMDELPPSLPVTEDSLGERPFRGRRHALWTLLDELSDHFGAMAPSAQRDLMPTVLRLLAVELESEEIDEDLQEGRRNILAMAIEEHLEALDEEQIRLLRRLMAADGLSELLRDEDDE